MPGLGRLVLVLFVIRGIGLWVGRPGTRGPGVSRPAFFEWKVSCEPLGLLVWVLSAHYGLRLGCLQVSL